MLTIPAKVIASCFGLTGFLAAVVVGLGVDNPFATILYRAMATMFVCWALGYGVGAVAQTVVDRHVTEYKKKNPLVNQAAKAPVAAEEEEIIAEPVAPEASPRGRQAA